MPSEENIQNKSSLSTRDLLTMRGTVEYIRYTAEDTCFVICDIETDTEETETLIGIMPYIAEGDSLTVYGRWEHNPKYGRQFRVEYFEKVMPADATSMLRYLSSRAVKGIGPKTAVKIVEEFGDDTFDIIENHPDWLAQIPGISKKKAEEIREDFLEKAGIRSTILFFREYFGVAITMKIHKKWGSAAVDIAKNNPYRLCDEIDGIGFEKADSMALGMGCEKNSSDRIKSGVLYILSHNAFQNGHVCLPREKLVAGAAKLLSVTEKEADEAVSTLLSEDKIKYSIYNDVKYMYDKISYNAEKYIAQKLTLVDTTTPKISIDDIPVYTEKEEKICGIKFADLQKQAIADSLRNGVMILTGGPGTGKTTIVKALIDIFTSIDMKVVLTAPTGRAAMRMSEATSREAKTIHRLLEMGYSDGDREKFCRDENNLLEEDIIIIDEASMVDNYLMYSLLKAVKPGARLIIIGDYDQLPSVGAGNVLRDLIESEAFATVRLNEIFRQARTSLIVTNAHAINVGLMPDLTCVDNDFFYIPRSSNSEIALTIADLCKNRLPKKYGEEVSLKIQVITPSRRGEGGTDNLNILLQDKLNPGTDGKIQYQHKNTVYRVGDRVMQIRNNYDVQWQRESGEGNGIFNGDIGVILDIDLHNSEMGIVFDDRKTLYNFDLLDDLELAYAITVHKSQGSEYPIVIIPAYNAPPMLLTRNLLYTAVTRAQKMVIIVGYKNIIESMVSNNRQVMRYTGLVHRLRT